MLTTGFAWSILILLIGLSGIAVLRASWSRRQRSQAMNSLGWALILGAPISGAAASGAWGFAVVALIEMAGALGLLAIAAVRSAPAKVRAPARRASLQAPERAGLRLATRIFTFVLVAFVAALLGLGIATASGGLVLLGGAGKSNAYATALFMMPIAWGVLAFALLMQSSGRERLKVLAIASIPSWPCLAAGTLS